MFSTYDLTDFGSALKEIRVSCSLTQSDVSNFSGVHVDTLRKIENGLVIPKYETLQYLSDIYKIDLLELLIDHKSNKDMLSFVDRINEIIVNNNANGLKDIVQDFNLLIHSNEKLNFMINNNEIYIFDLYLKSIEEYFKGTENNYLSSKNYLIEALSFSEGEFPYFDFEQRKFNYFEMSMLLLLGIVIFNLEELEASTRIMEFCLDRLKNLSSKSSTRNQMMLKLMFNLSYNYHIEDKHLDALSMASSAIEFALSINTLFTLPHLFYRKGIAEYELGIENYIDSLKKSISLLDICKMNDLKRLFINITRELYNIDLE